MQPTIPEGEVILETVRSSADESIIVLAVDDPVLVNALQRQAAAVLQKSTREGFGLTVTEAMWKGAAVIGGNVGGRSGMARTAFWSIRRIRPRNGLCRC